MKRVTFKFFLLLLVLLLLYTGVKVGEWIFGGGFVLPVFPQPTQFLIEMALGAIITIAIIVWLVVMIGLVKFICKD